jgi:glycosyltransferase involved in cell wall biosynthesis
MRVVERIVVTWLATASGGAERSSIQLCRTIRQRYQIDVTLVLWHFGGVIDLAPDVGSESDHVVQCYNADEYRDSVTAALAASSSTVLFSNHRTFAIDLQLAKQHGVPSAVIFRQTPMKNEAMRTLPTATSSDLVYSQGDQLDWEVLQGAAVLVGVSDFGARGLARFANHSRIVRIFNGVQQPGTSVAVTPRAVRRFLIVARLIDWKTIDFGIEAFGQFSAQHPDARLQIAGDGDEELRLRELARKLQLDDRVEFLGFVNDIQRVYLGSDCLLHPTAIESFGRVVIEASLCGLLVVVPQSAGTGELVINEHTGLTFRPNDLPDCVRALERASDMSDTDYARLAAAGRQRAIAMFNTDRVAEEYVGLANSII